MADVTNTPMDPTTRSSETSRENVDGVSQDWILRGVDGVSVATGQATGRSLADRTRVIEDPSDAELTILNSVAEAEWVIPVPVQAPGNISILVHEDALGHTVGTGTENNPDRDLSRGNLEAGTGQTDSATFSYADMSSLVATSDGLPAIIGLDLDGSIQGAPVLDTNGNPVFSKGEAVTYNINGVVIEGVTSDGRVVFTLTHNAAGGDPTDDSFTFNLHDQIDHPLANGDDSEILGLNVTPAFTAENALGTPLPLTGNLIEVSVEDDVPEWPIASPWETIGDASVGIDFSTQTFGPVAPPEGRYQAILRSGEATDMDIENFLGLVPGSLDGLNLGSAGPIFGDAIDGSAIKTTLSLNAGDVLTFHWYFGTTDHTPFNDFAFVSLNGSVVKLADIPDVGSYGNSGYQTFSFVVQNNGAFVLGFGVSNTGDFAIDSFVLIDNVQVNGVLVGGFEDSSPGGASRVSVLVHEDALSHVTGTGSENDSDADLSFGNLEPGTGQTDSATFSHAQFANRFFIGADEPARFSLDLDGSIQGTTVLDSDGNTVTSRGEVMAYNMNGGVIEGVAGSRVVFTLTHDEGDPSDPTDDTYTFNLDDQIDHPVDEADGEAPTEGQEDGEGMGDDQILSLDLTAAFNATDRDLDPVDLASNTIQVDVEEDVAKVVMVHEDALGHTHAESGNSTDDDLSLGNLEGTHQTDSATFSYGQLANLVNVGADVPARFALNSVDADGPGSIDGQAVVGSSGGTVTSQGDNVLYNVDGSVIEGVAEDGRVVFTLSHDDKGTEDPTDDSFNFNLHDQIDHPNGDGDDAETLTLNLTNAFLAWNSDWDPVELEPNSVKVDVEDDLALPADGEVASIEVHEDALNHVSGTGPDNSSDSDLSTGNLEFGTSQTDSASFSHAALSQVIKVGTDEPARFALNLAEGSIDGDIVYDSNGNIVRTQGEIVRYNVNGSEIEGVTSSGRVVFTLNHDDGGTPDDPTDDTFTFNLHDQIDHPSDDGDDAEILSLNLTGAFLAWDYDWDPVELADYTIQVDVEDDVARVADGEGLSQILVHEDALGHTHTSAGNNGTTDNDRSLGNLESTSQTDRSIFTHAELSKSLDIDADEPAWFRLYGPAITGQTVKDQFGNDVTSHGETVTYNWIADQISARAGGFGTPSRGVFSLSHLPGDPDDPTDDIFRLDLGDQIDHPNGDGNDLQTLALDLTAVFRAFDYDWDEVDLTDQKIWVNVEDDVPIANADVAATLENTAVVFNVLGNDDVGADEDAVLVSAAVDSSVGVVDFVATGEIAFAPNPEFVGEAVITYTMEDADGDQSTSTLTVTVLEDTDSILHVEMITDTNQSGQILRLTFTDAADPSNSFNKLMVFDGHGQAGSLLADVGFDIVAGGPYLVTIDWIGPGAGHAPAVFVTELLVEGVTLFESGVQGHLPIGIRSYATDGVAFLMQTPDGSNPDGAVLAGPLLSEDLSDGPTLDPAFNFLYDDTGADVLLGSDGLNILMGDGGGDVIIGGEGTDLLMGDEGNDVLAGLGGSDVLLGDDGDDVLVGGPGNDHLSGGPGNDTFAFALGDGVDIIDDFDLGPAGDADTIDLDALFDALNAALPGDVLDEASEREAATIVANDGTDTVITTVLFPFVDFATLLTNVVDDAQVEDQIDSGGV